MKTTNYFNTFIEVAEDCPVTKGEVPPQKAVPSHANIQFELIANNPYKYTSDDIVFGAYALKNDIPEDEREQEKQQYFSKGQPCLRTSPLAKRYGWGIHCNEKGKVAIYAVDSLTYEDFVSNNATKKVKAMSSKRGE